MTTQVLPNGFDWRFYCSYYSDLRQAGIDTEKKASDHYLQHGYREGRLTSATLAPVYSLRGEPENLVIGDSRRSFFEGGQQFCNYLVSIGKIEKTQSFLEVGSGVGVFARTLAGFIEYPGSYQGLETNRGSVEWCRHHITKDYPLCQFNYLSTGSVGTPQETAKIIFPYDASQFDCVFSSCAFLTLPPEECKQFLQEIARVLKRGGCCLISYLLWNVSLDLQSRTSRSEIRQIINSGDCKILINQLRERATAYIEGSLHEWHTSAKIPIAEIYYGGWSGVADNDHYPDIVLCRRR